jgi:hypothetical protein
LIRRVAVIDVAIGIAERALQLQRDQGIGREGDLVMLQIRWRSS